jgi:hypothetical protein
MLRYICSTSGDNPEGSFFALATKFRSKHQLCRLEMPLNIFDHGLKLQFSLSLAGQEDRNDVHKITFCQKAKIEQISKNHDHLCTN